MEERRLLDNDILAKTKAQQDIVSNMRHDTMEHVKNMDHNLNISRELSRVHEGDYYTDKKDILFCKRHEAFKESFIVNSVVHSDDNINTKADRIIGGARGAVNRQSAWTITPKIAPAASANAAEELLPYNTDHMVDIQYYQPDPEGREYKLLTGRFVSSVQQDSLRICEYVRDFYTLLSGDEKQKHLDKSIYNVHSALSRHYKRLNGINSGGVLEFGISLGNKFSSSMLKAISISSSSGEADEQKNTDKKKQSPSKSKKASWPHF